MTDSRSWAGGASLCRDERAGVAGAEKAQDGRSGVGALQWGLSLSP